jgi:3-hydroxyacyl-CoA dehydrogenase / enoyl-CoA hydratase / 3-hydroxybutyryl-CoA epimerase
MLETATLDTAMRLTISDKGLATVVIDIPDAKVNVLSETVMMQLQAILDSLTSNKSVKGLVFASAKPDSFIAGADVQAIKQLEKEPSIKAYEASKLGKMVFEKIEQLPYPTVAAINGICLGGGTELTLACKYRVASTNSAVTIGLPEVKLGVIPGWGGTVRLPKLIGLRLALDLILSGRTVSAKKAWQMQLIDECAEPDKLMACAEEIALGRAPRRASKSIKDVIGDFLLESNPIGRWILRDIAYKSMMRETKGKYPAPAEALKLLFKTKTRSQAESYEAESQVFSRLTVSEISRNLVGIFFAQTESKKMPTKVNSDQKIKTVGVLGAGVMGAGIAQAAAYAGYQVILKDVEQKFVDKGMNNIQKLFDGLLAKHKISSVDHDRMLAAIKPTIEYEQLQDCDLVIEAVLEDMKIKQDALASVERVNKKPFIFATNTSSLSVNELAKVAKEGKRVVGLHFFNPVHKMPLVEIIKGSATTDEVLAITKEFALKLGKTTVTSADAPGFIVNRILVPYLREAILLLEEGVPPESIDKAMKSFGMPMGPITLMDEIGLDVGGKVIQVLYAALGERMVPPAIMSGLDGLKILGKKGGKGFYLYDEKKKQAGFNPDVLALVKKEANPKMPNVIQDRLVLIMINEAARCLEEGVISEPSQLDLAMIFGTGFPPFRGGIIRYADSIGTELVCEKLGFLATVAGENYVPCKLLSEKAANHDTFYND